MLERCKTFQPKPNTNWRAEESLANNMGWSTTELHQQGHTELYKRLRVYVKAGADTLNTSSNKLFSQGFELLASCGSLKCQISMFRPRGRPKKTWREIVEKDCRARGLNTEDAMCRSRWRKQIGMIDDHDDCSGWMFLLVPAHPGCPGQIPQSRKTVVCVCVDFNTSTIMKIVIFIVIVLRGSVVV